MELRDGGPGAVLSDCDSGLLGRAGLGPLEVESSSTLMATYGNWEKSMTLADLLLSFGHAGDGASQTRLAG